MAREMSERGAIGSNHLAFVALFNVRCSHITHCWPMAGPAQHFGSGRRNNLPCSTLSQTRKPKSLGVRSFMVSARSYEVVVSLDSAEDRSSDWRTAIDSRSHAR